MQNLSYSDSDSQKIMCPMCDRPLELSSEGLYLRVQCMLRDKHYNHFIYNSYSDGYSIFIFNYPFYIFLSRTGTLIFNELLYISNYEYKTLKELDKNMTTLEAIKLINNLDYLKLFI